MFVIAAAEGNGKGLVFLYLIATAPTEVGYDISESMRRLMSVRKSFVGFTGRVAEGKPFVTPYHSIAVSQSDGCAPVVIIIFYRLTMAGQIEVMILVAH